MKAYEIAVAAPVPKTLTYAHPGEPYPQEIIPTGMRVIVPLGRRKVTGYVLGQVDTATTEKTDFTVKSILEVPDQVLVFPEALIPFYRWIAEYYHYPLGEVIKTALPGGLVSSSRKVIRMTESGEHDIVPAVNELDDTSFQWAKNLVAKGALSSAQSMEILKQPASRKLIAQWQNKGWIDVADELQQKYFLEKKEHVAGLAPGFFERLSDRGQKEELEKQLAEYFPDLKKSEQKTLLIVCDLCGQQGSDHVRRPDITRRYTGAGKALKSLAEQGLVTVEERKVYRDPFGQEPQFYPRPEQLSSDQEQVLAKILPHIEEPTFQTFVLHGVTGCGKTEVYLRCAERVMDKGGTALVLVPEIALSSQLEAHFYSRFGDVVAVLHSGLTAGERHDQWQRIASGQARIVVGARSAVFAPMAKPSLIIVDEEHEPAYKQEDGLRYNGRDLAVLRGRFAGCPVILGSATPSITTYYQATSGKYTLLQMPRRITGQQLPDVEVVDLGNDRRSRPDLLFSDKLISALWENMEKRQQSLLFVNRRGFASFVMCRDCGHIVQCRHCQVSLTLHRHEQRLICHYCGFSLPQKLICPSCSSAQIEGMGLGSERIEEEVRQIIPHARVARLDSDTATSRKHHQKTLRAVQQQDVDILVGTQMIAKGLHFPNVTLVGVVWADSGLGIPDFRASERTFQLLAQVTGRAGRGTQPGKVIIQTYQPYHYAVECARQHDYASFYMQEKTLREDLQYPPFARLVNIRFSATAEEQVRECAQKTADFLHWVIRKKKISDIEILGPVPAPLVRIKDRVRWQLLLKGVKPPTLHSLCYMLQEQRKTFCSGQVRVSVDVDPESMM